MDYLGEESYPPPPAPLTSPDTPSNSSAHPQHQEDHHLDQSHSLPHHPPPQSAPETPSNPAPPLADYKSPAAASPYISANPSDPYDSMPPPPQQTYDDLPTLMLSVQSHARAHGYAVVTSSNNYKRGIAYVRCDRGGEYVNHWNVTPETRVRKNRTRRLVGCKWKARAKRLPDGTWNLTMMEDKHNGHGPSGDLSQHPSLRQLPDEAVEEAKGLFLAGRTPKDVLERLKTWNEAVTPQDVYNLKAKISRKDRASEKGTPVRGSRLRGSGGPGTNGTIIPGGQVRNDVQMSNSPAHGINGEGEGIVDPALRAPDGIAQLTAAVAQMQDNAELPTATAAVAAVNGAAHGGKKCDCQCCDH